MPDVAGLDAKKLLGDAMLKQIISQSKKYLKEGMIIITGS